MAIGYFSSFTGDCSNSNQGSVYIEPYGGVANYTVDFYSPDLPVQIGTGLTFTSLSAGTYYGRINDSSMGVNEDIYFTVVISSGVCTTISSVSATTCGQNSGQLTVTNTGNILPYSYYLYRNDSMVFSAQTTSTTNTFYNLTAGTYYVLVTDGGGCSGMTNSAIVRSSPTLNYGLYTINDASCNGPTGKIYVTGLTGTAPYIYEWSNDVTTTFISGLTQGSYGVTITDGSGCSTSKSASISLVPSVGVVTMLPTSPSCFKYDGSVTVTISGGTAPYYYVGSNGETWLTYSSSYTFEGLGAGNFGVEIIDAAFCTATSSVTLQTPNAFNLVDLTTTNSSCSASGGSVNIVIQGGQAPYIYTIVGPNGYTSTKTSNSTTQTFTDLQNGDYTLYVSNGSSCSYETEFSIIAENKFVVSAITSNTTCGNQNGYINLSCSEGGTLPLTYQISGNKSVTTNSLTYLFEGLNGGVYDYFVTDFKGCVQSGTSVVNVSSPVTFTLSTVNCVDGSNGSIVAMINNGEPPFTLNWSSNVNGQTGIYVTGLTAGTYSLTVTDVSGCTLTKTTTITCGSQPSGGGTSVYQLFKICEGNFIENPSTKRTLLKTLNEGFNDSVADNVNCRLESANFNVVVTTSGSVYTQQFYSSTSLTDVPSDSQYYSALQAVLDSVVGVGAVVIDQDTNILTVNTDCNLTLSDQELTIDLIINYVINCVS